MKQKYALVNLPNTIPKFLDRITIDKKGCWNWKSSLNEDGYGVTTKRPFKYLAHRFIYFYYHENINTNLELHHLCRNRKCVNPNHLEQVTHRYHMIISNCVSTLNASKMECKRGHPFDFYNTYINPGTGQRQCRICRYNYNKNIRLKIKEVNKYS